VRNLADALLMARLEILCIMRHDMRGTIENLAAILAQIGASRSPDAKLLSLVSAAENNLRSLSHLTDSLRTVLETDINPTQMTTEESLYDITRAAISTLAHRARGVRLHLQRDQNTQFTCDRRMIELLLMSSLIFLLKALRNDQSATDIRIAVEGDKAGVHVDMRFYLGPRWREQDSNDDGIAWKMVTKLVSNCGGSIEPRELSQLRQHLRLSFPKS
jgi:hypothetical protein